MSFRSKRTLDEFDPNKSDTEDLDYDESSPQLENHSSRRHSKNGTWKPQKRQRLNLSDSNIDDDDDDDEPEKLTSDSSTSSDVDINPRTLRRVRSAAAKRITYHESTDSDIDIEECSHAAGSHPSGNKNRNCGRKQNSQTTQFSGATTPSRLTRHSQRSVSLSDKKSLLVTLSLPPSAMRSSTSIRDTAKRLPSPDSSVRKSTRLSRDSDEAMFALSNSGRHLEVVRPVPRSPGSSAHHRFKGGKGPKKAPMIINIEASSPDHLSINKTVDTFSTTSRSINPQNDLIIDHKNVTTKTNITIQTKYSDIETELTSSNDVNPQTPNGACERLDERKENSEEDPPEAKDSFGAETEDDEPIVNRRRSTWTNGKKRNKREESSDFEPTLDDEEDDELNFRSNRLNHLSRRNTRNEEHNTHGRRSSRLAARSQRQDKTSDSDDPHSGLDPDELAEEAEELAELNSQRHRSRRRRQSTGNFHSRPRLRNRDRRPDYRVFRPELLNIFEEDQTESAPPPAQSRRGYRNLFPIAGPFGGQGDSLITGNGSTGGAAAGVDSDSSDDDFNASKITAGAVGAPSTGLGALIPTNPGCEASAGGPSSHSQLGRIKDRKALADADPLGVDASVSFDSVGGLDEHINRLKEMVMLPLLYPEVFQRFHVTPPRGVLFHGPPGTGKTLLARALASSVSLGDRKITFYMRKGADALSKWAGEAERQLRLLFDDARKNQPSIIFFDEVDGLAPVRSSKQEQIHASIVATLLALMDGMDGRGQIIVIGATNRPDNVDPALRRPGRFDREFYFPLPNFEARRSIIDIYTKDWDPPLSADFKNQIAQLTKGYGGADLRALCTEAALNAVQGTYPQIYMSDAKLRIDPSNIRVQAKDFLISVKKIIPSSERSSSRAMPLSNEMLPLFRTALEEVTAIIHQIIPQSKKLTALEEAQYDDRDDEQGFEMEILMQTLEKARIFRPRLLIKGPRGMGQRFLGQAVMQRFETFHLQSFDLATLLEDSARSADAGVVQLFKEARSRKPSVLYISDVDVWCEAVSPSVMKTFTSLLNSLPPDEAILVLGTMEERNEDDDEVSSFVREVFRDNEDESCYIIRYPDSQSRREFFQDIESYIRMKPVDFPNLDNRKKRTLEKLEILNETKPIQGPSKTEIKAQKKHDRHILNLLKMQIQPVMDQIKAKYKKFRTPVIEDSTIRYLLNDLEARRNADGSRGGETNARNSDEGQFRPYELSQDKHGITCLLEKATGKRYYNLDIVVIEKRLCNGFYRRPKDFLADIKRLLKDALTSEDTERTLRAREMVSIVEVDLTMIESSSPALVAECEALHLREMQRRQNEKTAAEAKDRLTGDERSNICKGASHGSGQRCGEEEFDGKIVDLDGDINMTNREDELERVVDEIGEIGTRMEDGYEGSREKSSNGKFGDDSTHKKDISDFIRKEVFLSSRASTAGELEDKAGDRRIRKSRSMEESYEGEEIRREQEGRRRSSHGWDSRNSGVDLQRLARQSGEENVNKFGGTDGDSGGVKRGRSFVERIEAGEVKCKGIGGGGNGGKERDSSNCGKREMGEIRDKDERKNNHEENEDGRAQTMYKLSEDKLRDFSEKLVDMTQNWVVEKLLEIRAKLIREIWKRREEWNRDVVIECLTRSCLR